MARDAIEQLGREAALTQIKAQVIPDHNADIWCHIP
jgi:hypothetical protein